MSSSSSPGDGPSRSHKILFWASFFTLIAAGIGFSVRGVDLLSDWGNQFGFTDVKGVFTDVVDPNGKGKAANGMTVEQLLGVNDKEKAVGFWTDAEEIMRQ